MQFPSAANVYKVLRWEFLKTVKSPAFLLITFLLPLIMVFAGGIGFITEHLARSETMQLSVVDKTGNLFSYLEEQSRDTPVSFSLFQGETGLEEFEEIINKDQYNGILVIEESQLEQGNITVYVEGTREIILNPQVNEIVNSAAASYRIDQSGMDPEQVYRATSPVRLDTRQVTGEELNLADIIVPAVAGFALILSVMVSGSVLMQGVIKEKRNRVVEILLSSISSLELLLGKLFAFGVLGLLQVGVWLGAGIFAVVIVLEALEMSLTASLLLPPLLFFLFGYLMYFSIFAAVGATLKEAEGGSQFQGLIVMIPILPLMISGPLLQAPEALWAKIISHIPIFTPTTVLLRMGATSLPAWEIATTLAVLALSTVLFLYLGARIFEATILQYDRIIGLKDIVTLFTK